MNSTVSFIGRLIILVLRKYLEAFAKDSFVRLKMAKPLALVELVADATIALKYTECNRCSRKFSRLCMIESTRVSAGREKVEVQTL